MFLTKWILSLMKPIVERNPRIASFYRNVRDQICFMQEPVTTPWTFKLAGNSKMAQGTFEPEETELVRNILKDVDVLVNVGANVGYYCCHALSMGKAVIAFEPNQQNLRYLCKNIKSNGWSGAEVYPIALSNTIDVLEMYGGDTGASILKGWADTPESFMTLVPSSTMDIVLGNRLQGRTSLVIIDVEGAEKWMLEGATIMLASDPKPIWLVEITARDNQPRGVEMNPHFSSTFQMFFQHGYQAFSVNQDLNPISMEDVESIARGDMELKTHNFLFRGPAKE